MVFSEVGREGAEVGFLFPGEDTELAARVVAFKGSCCT